MKKKKGKRRVLSPKFIITFLSSCRWGLLSAFRGNNLKELCHTLLRIRGQPVGMRPDYWSQHPESKKRSMQMFAGDIGPQAPHMKPFQPEPPFTFRAHRQRLDRVSNPKKGCWGSELESPLLLKAQ